MRRKQRKGIDLGRFGWAPKVLTDGAIAGVAVLVICLFAGAGLLDRYIKEHGTPYIAAVISAVLVELANDDRAEALVDQLTVNPKLVAAAQAKANDMAEKGYFAHQTPEGYDSWHWFELVGYDYSHAGENLAVDFSESADVEKAWMASPTHRDNILNERYTEIGIAVAHGVYKGRSATFAVQMFGRPSAVEVARRVGAPPAASAPLVTPSGGVTLGETTGGVLAEKDSVVLSAAEIPWWGWIAAQPKETLRYAYLIIGLLILAALFFDVEIEFKRHHIKHAMKAGMVLATMSVLFIAADWVFFAEPILAAAGELLH